MFSQSKINLLLGNQRLPSLELRARGSQFGFLDRLKVRLVLNFLPVAAPLQSQALPNVARRSIKRRFGNVLPCFEESDVPCDAEVVIALPTARVGDNWPRKLRSALCKNRVLLRISAGSRNDLEDKIATSQAVVHLLQKCPGLFLYIGLKRLDVTFRAQIK